MSGILLAAQIGETNRNSDRHRLGGSWNREFRAFYGSARALGHLRRMRGADARHRDNELFSSQTTDKIAAADYVL